MKTGTQQKQMKRLAFLNDDQQEIVGISLAPGQALEVRVARRDGEDAFLNVPARLRLDDDLGALENRTRFRAGDQFGYGVIVAEHEGLRGELLVVVSGRDSQAAALTDPVV